MKYLMCIYCPDDATLIDNIISAASEFGAGTYGNYSRCAFVTRGDGTWKSEDGAHPYEGRIGEITHSRVAKISMSCDAKNAKEIIRAIRAIHPWEQVDVECMELADL